MFKTLACNLTSSGHLRLSVLALYVLERKKCVQNIKLSVKGKNHLTGNLLCDHQMRSDDTACRSQCLDSMTGRQCFSQCKDEKKEVLLKF